MVDTRRRNKYTQAAAPAAPADYLTVAQIASLEDCNEGTIRVWIRSGQLPAKVEKPGTRWPRYVVRKEDYWRFVDGDK